MERAPEPEQEKPRRAMPPKLRRPERRIEFQTPPVEVLMIRRLGLAGYQALRQAEDDARREESHRIHEELWDSDDPMRYEYDS